MIHRFVIIASFTAIACAHHEHLNEVTPTQVAQWQQQGAVSVFDANNESFRKQYGTVPGAVLLADYKGYDLKLLGDDKARQLVFYCSNRL